MVYEIVVVTLLLPALTSAAVVFVELICGERRPAGRTDKAAWIAGGVAAAGSFLLSYALYDWTSLRPSDPWHWLPHAMLGMTIAVIVAAVSRRWWAWVILVPGACTFAWQLTPAWPDVAPIRPLAASGLAAAMLVYLFLILPLGDARRSKEYWLIGIVLTLNLIAAMVVIERSSWAQLTQLSVLPIVALSVLTIAAWLYPQRQFLCGAVPTLAVALPAMLMLAWYYTYTTISPWAFVLVALGPLALLLVLLSTLRMKRAAQIIAMFSALALPAAGVAVALATFNLPV
jgi:hypothetical protein